jgi:hypothetical protein
MASYVPTPNLRHRTIHYNLYISTEQRSCFKSRISHFYGNQINKRIENMGLQLLQWIMYITYRIFRQPNFERIITSSGQGLYTMAEMLLQVCINCLKISSMSFISHRDYKEHGSRKEKDALKRDETTVSSPSLSSWRSSTSSR